VAEPAASEPVERGATVGPQVPVSTRRVSASVIGWGITIVAALLVAFLIKTFLVQAFYIPSGSMEPTLMPGDRVLVNKVSYDLHDVHRGDIVVFSRPPNDNSPGVKDLIKRVIGLPGETVSGQANAVYIDGQRLNESWLPKGVTTAAFPPITVPKGYYFVMGDNRGNSEDSRILGPVSGKLIVGRAFIRVWPLSKIHLF
jgi:signal peptidase I